MNSGYEGDLIRPLGLVTLHAAYAEGEIEELLIVLMQKRPLNPRVQAWSTGRKIQYARNHLSALSTDHHDALIDILDEAKSLFKDRNTLIHGRIYAGGRLISSRGSVTEIRISAEEVLDLADRIFSCKERVSAYTQRYLIPAIQNRVHRGRF